MDIAVLKKLTRSGFILLHITVLLIGKSHLDLLLIYCSSLSYPRVIIIITIIVVKRKQNRIDRLGPCDLGGEHVLIIMYHIIVILPRSIAGAKNAREILRNDPRDFTNRSVDCRGSDFTDRS